MSPDTSVAAGDPAGGLPGAGADTVPDAAPAGTPGGTPADSGWTAGVTRVEHSPAGVAVLTAVRTARQAGYDRIVLEFGAGELPGYALEYIDRPVRQCGSGNVVPLGGDAWLQIELIPAHAHTEAGAPTIEDRSRAPDLPNVKQLVLTCDFEAHVVWVAAVATPGRYRVLELREPTRLVVDVLHD